MTIMMSVSESPLDAQKNRKTDKLRQIKCSVKLITIRLKRPYAETQAFHPSALQNSM